jgi:hypothetical protein
MFWTREGDLAACAPWSQQLLRVHFRASYKPIMSMTRLTEIHFVLDIMRVYTMTRLVERGAAVDRTTQTIEIGGSARRFSPVEEAGLLFGLLAACSNGRRLCGPARSVGRQSKQPNIRPSAVCGDKCLVCLIGIEGLAGNGFRQTREPGWFVCLRLASSVGRRI